MNNSAMLNAYPDSLGGTLADIVDLLRRPEMQGTFGSFYILPSLFHTDLDRGFSVISYDLNKQFATRQDLDELNRMGLDLKLDFVLNHLSVLSPQFQDILEKGEQSAYRDFFVDWNKFWQGKGEMTSYGYIQPDEQYLRDMFFRKPGLPILMVRFPDGREVPYWNTFYQDVRYDLPDEQDLMRATGLQYGQAAELVARIRHAVDSRMPLKEMNFSGFEAYKEQVVDFLEGRRKYLGQMDVNVRSPAVWAYYEETLDKLRGYGAAIVRLDAFGYASKIPGHKNFMNEPETWDILNRLKQMAQARGLTLLPEIHAAYGDSQHRLLADKGFMVYDFFLPGLLIDALENHEGGSLVRWAREQREAGICCVNMLGCHDGIPLLDLKGLVPDERIQNLIDLIVGRGGLIKNLHGQTNLYYQVNATYYSALGADDRKMLLARALQLFMPGKPQVWYLDLFAGENDLEAVRKGGPAGHKEINRTNLTKAMLEERLQLPVVQRQLMLLKMYNKCEAFAFDADFEMKEEQPHCLLMKWSKNGKCASLKADLRTYAFEVEMDVENGRFHYAQEA